MIRYVTAEREADFLTACTADPVFGTRIQTLYACYGRSLPSLDCWVAYGGGVPTAALARFDGYFTVAARGQADLAECAAFVRAAGGYVCVQGPPAICRVLAERGGHFFCSSTMRYAGNGFPAAHALADASPSPAQVYDVLCKADPAFARQSRWEVWYTHTSHLLRHGLGFATVLYAPDGTPAATAGVYAQNAHTGVLAAVATIPSHRGKGYASQAVRQVVNRLLASEKTPVLACADDSLVPFYTRLGFAPLGQWGQYAVAPV